MVGSLYGLWTQLSANYGGGSVYFWGYWLASNGSRFFIWFIDVTIVSIMKLVAFIFGVDC